LGWPLQTRAKDAHQDVVPASHHIYCQHIQMGQFLSTMYEPGERIALNDLGAVSYYTDASILDLWGLGSIDVVSAKRRDEYDTEEIERLLRKNKTNIVMVYQSWFYRRQELPEYLFAVADWSLSKPYFGRTVTFLATSEKEARGLRERLREFQSRLPSSVKEYYHQPKVPLQGTD
ncbi:MAG: hypothetical protein IH989_07935, partial [Planctomycetes bacterium]|nr:hypothetical protein [Planctomycetota bacterium]